MPSVIVVRYVNDPPGEEWGVSFSDHNPEEKDWVPLRDRATAEKLAALINA